MTGAGGGGGGIGGEARGHGQQDSVGGGGDGGWGVTGSGFGSSPFPAVDSFLRSACVRVSSIQMSHDCRCVDEFFVRFVFDAPVRFFRGRAFAPRLIVP